MEKEEDSPNNGNLKDLKRLPSVGNLTARALKKKGFNSTSELEQADIEELQSIEQIGDNLAEKIKEELNSGDLIDKEEVDETLELRCPVCQKFTKPEEDICKECEEPVKSTSRVVVPEKGLIEKPLETLASVEEKILFDGEDPESWFIRGSILESMGANRQALESFDRVIELDPLFDHIWNAKANVSLKVGETGEAAKAYKLAFDAHQGPNSIMGEIEEKKTSPSEVKEDLKEIDEKDKKLDEKISKARKLLDQTKEREEELSEMVMTLDRVTEEKIRGNRAEALKLVENIIQRTEAWLKIDEQFTKLKNEIEQIDCKSLMNRAENDLEEIQTAIKNNDYIEAKRLVTDLSYALEFEKKKQEEKIPSEKRLDKIIDNLDVLSRELTDKTDKIFGLSESVSAAKEYKEDGDLESAFKALRGYIDNETVIRDISENIEKIDTMKISLENLDFEEKFIEEINERFEEGKELCKEGDYKRGEETYEDLLKDIETNIEDSVEDVDEELEIKIKDIERIIDKGEERGLNIEGLKEAQNRFGERLESGGEKRELLEEIEETIDEGENILAFKSNISKIDEKIEELDESIDDTEYKEKKSELKDIFQKGDHDEAIERSLELKNEIEDKIVEIEEKKDLKSKAESKLAQSRKKLSRLRKTDFDLTRMKALLKNSNYARKKGDTKQCVKLADRFIESADQMIELSEPVEKSKDLVDQLAEEDLIEEDKINYEIEQFKRLSDLEKFEMAERYLLELIEELEEALEKGNKVPPPGDEFDKSSTQIPTQIKEKVRNVKELNNLVEKADIEIEVNREPLKDAIIKIKDIEYEEANEILNEWKDKLIERLNHELGDRVDEMSEEIENIECPSSVQKRGEAIFRDIRKKWKRGGFEDALKGLIYAAEFIDEVEEEEKNQDKEILLVEKLLEDIERLGYADKEMEKILDKARDNKENEEEFKKLIEELREKIKERLNEALDEESKRLGRRVQGLDQSELVVALSNILDLKEYLKKENLEGAAWVGKEYIEIVG